MPDYNEIADEVYGDVDESAAAGKATLVAAFEAMETMPPEKVAEALIGAAAAVKSKRTGAELAKIAELAVPRILGLFF